jgi:hypothetical protein
MSGEKVVVEVLIGGNSKVEVKGNPTLSSAIFNEDQLLLKFVKSLS